MKNFLISILFIFVAGVAQAQSSDELFSAGVANLAAARLGDDAALPKNVRGNARYWKQNNASSTPVSAAGLNASNQYQIAVNGGTPTPVALFDSVTGLNFPAGYGISQAPYVPTLAATPLAANQYVPGLNVIPTNAANNAGFLGAATPVVGQQFKISNASGAAQRIKAAGGATLNGATAGGYISIASLATVDCFTQSLTNQVCEQPVIPTPAGP